jgi:glycosyltransferase involved in cell wall biosynthesis
MEYMALWEADCSFRSERNTLFCRRRCYLCPPNQEAEFAEAIAQLMGQPELRKKMGAYGRRRVEEELQWNKVGRSLLAAYEALLAKG